MRKIYTLNELIGGIYRLSQIKSKCGSCFTIFVLVTNTSLGELSRNLNQNITDFFEPGK